MRHGAHYAVLHVGAGGGEVWGPGDTCAWGQGEGVRDAAFPLAWPLAWLLWSGKGQWPQAPRSRGRLEALHSLS